MQLEKSVQKFLRNAIAEDFICSAHDISDGGLAVAIAECCITSGLGAHCQLSKSEARLDRLLFGEGGARILVSISSQKEDAWKTLLKEVNDQYPESVPSTKIGTVKEESELLITQMEKHLAQIPLFKLKESFENSIPRRISQESNSLL